MQKLRMNSNDGGFEWVKDTQDEGHGTLRLRVGGTLELAGVELRVVHINTGKRRFSLTPVNPNVQIGEPEA